MKAWIREIKGPEPCNFGPAGEALRWRPMIIKLVVDAPKDAESAGAQVRLAKSWAEPSYAAGRVITPPSALELLPMVEWPTCAECGTDVRLAKVESDLYLAECHLCGGGSTGPTPHAALAEFARELGPKEEG